MVFWRYGVYCGLVMSENDNRLPCRIAVILIYLLNLHA